MRGRFSGLSSFAWLGGNLLGSWTGLTLYAVDPGLLWLLCGVAGVVAAAVLLSVRVPAAVEAPDAVRAGAA
jgi:hypothetical protein